MNETIGLQRSHGAPRRQRPHTEEVRLLWLENQPELRLGSLGLFFKAEACSAPDARAKAPDFGYWL